jgi:polyhydroxyalkanoate synthesis repressor PhaR
VQEASSPSAERVVKRYANRKLYDTRGRRYVTLQALARQIGEGEEVRVLDQATGEDITRVVLGQVMLEGLRQRSARIPTQVLNRLVRTAWGGATSGPAWRGAQDAAARARGEVERVVASLAAQGRLSLDEALAVRQELTQSVQRIVTDAQRALEGSVHRLIERAEKEGGARASLESLRQRLLTIETSLEETRPRRRGPRRTQGRRPRGGK